MSWEKIKGGEWVEKIVSYPSEGVLASRDKIKKIVYLHGSPASKSELEDIIDAICEAQDEVEVAITEKMIADYIRTYRFRKRQEELEREKQLKMYYESFSDEQ